MAGELPVTVVVPTRNEERHLGECLSRLGRFGRVIVVDSESRDATADIARAHGAHVVAFRWDGRYPKKRNWTLLNHRFETAWVLFLDTDELVDDAFCDELRARLPVEGHAGYWLAYRNWFLGRPLRHGVAQRKLALFRVGAGLYERIDEDRWSGLDMEVHEHPVIAGTTGEMRSVIEHMDFGGVAGFVERHADYARWEARRWLALRSAGRGEATLSRRQRFKYHHLDRWWFPWAYFLGDYVLKLGVLDGRAGFHHAFYKLWYFMTVRLIARELAGGQGRPSPLSPGRPPEGPLPAERASADAPAARGPLGP